MNPPTFNIDLSRESFHLGKVCTLDNNDTNDNNTYCPEFPFLYNHCQESTIISEFIEHPQWFDPAEISDIPFNNPIGFEIRKRDSTLAEKIYFPYIGRIIKDDWYKSLLNDQQVFTRQLLNSSSVNSQTVIIPFLGFYLCYKEILPSGRYIVFFRDDNDNDDDDEKYIIYLTNNTPNDIFRITDTNINFTSKKEILNFTDYIYNQISRHIISKFYD